MSPPIDKSNESARVDRRTLLATGGVALGGLLAAPWLRDVMQPRASVFVARNQRYDGPLAATIRDGLLAAGAKPQEFHGRRVLLKPNMVEPSRAVPHMTTHPAVIVAAAEVFLGWGAEVCVGEAPGHVRDTEMALEESGVGEALADVGV